MAGPTRAQIRQFGREVKKGDLFTNRWEEHGRGPRTRILEVVLDIKGTAYFALRDQKTGKTTVMRARTLKMRYQPLH